MGIEKSTSESKPSRKAARPQAVDVCDEVAAVGFGQGVITREKPTFIHVNHKANQTSQKPMFVNMEHVVAVHNRGSFIILEANGNSFSIDCKESIDRVMAYVDGRS